MNHDTRQSLLSSPVSWVVASLLGTAAASMATADPIAAHPWAPEPSVLQDRIVVMPDGPASTLAREAGGASDRRTVAGGEVRMVPLLERDDRPRLPVGRSARAGEEGDTAEAGASGNPHVLAFTGGEYAPGPDERVDPLLLQASSMIPLDGRDGDFTYGFVMFEGRITPERTQQLEELGLRVLGYFPHNALRVAIPGERVQTVAGLDFVRWVGAARPYQKLHPSMEDALEAPAGRETIEVVVSVFESDLNSSSQRLAASAEAQATSPGGELMPASPAPLNQGSRWRTNGWQEASLEAAGLEIDQYSSRTDAFRGRISRERLEQLTDLDHVQFIEPWFEPTVMHDESMPLVNLDASRDLYDGTYSGEVVVGQADTGVKTGHIALDHFWGVGTDLTGSTGGASWDLVGHGSHVAGTILGLGTSQNESSLSGASPRLGYSTSRRYFHTKIFDDSGAWGGATIAEILDTFAEPYTDSFSNTTPRPHVVNHSWGTPSTSVPWVGTENDCRELDVEAWLRGQLHVVAAGNSGPTGGTLSLQGSAKNAFTVGNIWSHPDTSSGAPGQLSFDSSRGPTADLRWKPNVVAPGRWIESVDASTLYDFVHMGGTSMSAAHVTGLAAQLVDHWEPLQSYHGPTLGALLMASGMTAGGIDLANPSTSSTSHYNTYGAGRISATKAHAMGDQDLYFWDFSMENGSGHVELDFTVGDGATRVTTVMLYHEIPGAAGAATSLVNDLDMYIDRPPYTGVGNTGDWFAHQSSRDNMEIRTLSNPLPATYLIKVYPEDLPAGFLNVAFVGVAVVVEYGEQEPDLNLSLGISSVYAKPDEVVSLTAGAITPSGVGRAVQFNQDSDGGTLLGARHLLQDGSLAQLMDNAHGGDRILVGETLPGETRLVWWDAAWSTEGEKVWSVEMTAENTEPETEQYVVTVDGTEPEGPFNLDSPTHPIGSYSCSTTVEIVHSGGWDALSGVDGYSAIFDQSPLTSAPEVINLPSTNVGFSDDLSISTNPYYAHIRAVDRSGNWGETQHYGPFYITYGDATNYCTAAPNSAYPSGAVMGATGGPSLSQNDFALVANGIPQSQPSLFFFGPGQAHAAFGNGFLCVSGTIVRLPVVSNQFGQAVFGLDFHGSLLSGVFQGGETWYFQNWYRDPAGGSPGFNLTDGLAVTFCD